MNLNSRQKRAVTHRFGPLLIVAGAGTGKTRVITERIKYLIEKRGSSPKEIVALTFTEKAAREMLDRVDSAMPLGYEEPYVSTFHSFCERILREKGIEIGLDPNFKILNFTNSWLLLRENLFNFNLKYFRPLGNPSKFISAILKFFSRLQDENVLAEEFENYVKLRSPTLGFGLEEEERWSELFSLYKDYSKLKIEKSYLDFGDLIIWTLKLFSKRSNILLEYKNRFKHIMIDEFQDTNWAQYKLIKLLAPSESNPDLVVVGDDNQSIYKFRGAAISNILDFKKDYPSACEIILNKNYRSFQKILDLAHILVKNNDPDTLEVKLGISKKLESQRSKGKGDCVFYVALDTAESEAEFVAEEIIKLLGEPLSYTYKDFAVLARANSHLEPFIAAFKRYGMPYQVAGNRGLFDTPEVKVLSSFLRFLVDKKDSVSLYHLLASGTFDILDGEIWEILQTSRREKTSIWNVLKKSTHQNICEKLEKIRSIGLKEPASRVLYKFVVEFEIAQKLIENESLESNLKLKNINLFFDYIKSFESKSDRDTDDVSSFIDYLNLALDAGENPAQSQIEDIDTVNLMTVHSSKGLEFPVVFMVSLTGDRFPTRVRSDLIDIPDEFIKETLPKGNFHIQEERRLFYVGLTRAEDRCYLTYAKNYGGVREKKPSGYIAETGIRFNTTLLDNTDQLSLFFKKAKDISAPKPRFIKDGRLEVPFLSYSQIDFYSTCPLKYKYKYILSIPTPSHYALTFGSTVHKTLNEFEQKSIEKELSLEDMSALYKKNFDSAGYESKFHRDKMYKEGKKQLEIYFSKRKDIFTKPKLLEKSFRVVIEGIPFVGKIDRVDSLGSGFEIIDYKTGSPKDQKMVDKDDQLTYYAIGAIEQLKITPKKLSLYFVRNGEKVSTTRGPEDFKKAKEKVVETAKNIKEGRFTATPGILCNYCEFKPICPAYKSFSYR